MLQTQCPGGISGRNPESLCLSPDLRVGLRPREVILVQGEVLFPRLCHCRLSWGPDPTHRLILPNQSLTRAAFHMLWEGLGKKSDGLSLALSNTEA